MSWDSAVRPWKVRVLFRGWFMQLCFSDSQALVLRMVFCSPCREVPFLMENLTCFRLKKGVFGAGQKALSVSVVFQVPLTASAAYLGWHVLNSVTKQTASVRR